MPKTTREIVEKALYKKKINWIADKEYQKIIDEKWYSEEKVDKIIKDCFKIKLLTEEFKKTGIIKCTYCFKAFTKIDEYTFKPNCDCIKKDIRVSIG